MPIIQTTPPAFQAVTLAEARRQCRIDADITLEDAYLTESLIPAATQYCEQYMNRPIMAQGFSWHGQLVGDIELKASLQNVTAVKYLNAQGAQLTLPVTEYFVDKISLVGNVQPMPRWPATQAGHPQPASIEFTAGWPTPEAVPASIKQAVLLLISHWFDNREAVMRGNVSEEVEFSTHALLDQYRIYSL